MEEGYFFFTHHTLVAVIGAYLVTHLGGMLNSSLCQWNPANAPSTLTAAKQALAAIKGPLLVGPTQCRWWWREGDKD